MAQTEIPLNIGSPNIRQCYKFSNLEKHLGSLMDYLYLKTCLKRQKFPERI